MTILIIAGDYTQYKRYLADNRVGSPVYVYSENQLRGYNLDEVKVIFYGTYWKNPAYSDSLYRKTQGMVDKS